MSFGRDNRLTSYLKALKISILSNKTVKKIQFNILYSPFEYHTFQTSSTPVFTETIYPLYEKT